MKKIFYIFLFLSLCSVGVYLYCHRAPKRNNKKTYSKKTIINTISYTNKYWIVISPDKNHYAYLEKSNNKMWTVFDGKKNKEYDEIISGEKYSSLQFSPDSTSIAYIAKRNNILYLVHNSYEIKMPYDRILFNFIPNTNNFVIRAWKNKKVHVIMNGNDEREYDDVGPVIFSGDGKQYAYKAKDGRYEVVVVNGKEIDRYMSGTQPLFDSPVFYDSDQKLAYMRYAKNISFMVNGVQGPFVLFEDELPGTIVISPDGKHVMYGALYKNKPSIFIDNQLKIKSPSGEKILYTNIGFTPDGNIYYLFNKENKNEYYLQLNNITEGPYTGIFWPMFSPDNKQYAYVANTKGKGTVYSVVINGKVQHVYEFASNKSIVYYPVFSSDSKVVFYKIENADVNDKEYLVINEKASEKFDKIYEPQFSSDNKKVSYYALQNNTLYKVEDSVH
jgi:dipeptidyl aminopeptidase/acylaminoacyl peptidase